MPEAAGRENAYKAILFYDCKTVTINPQWMIGKLDLIRCSVHNGIEYMAHSYFPYKR